MAIDPYPYIAKVILCFTSNPATILPKLGDHLVPKPHESATAEVGYLHAMSLAATSMV